MGHAIAANVTHVTVHQRPSKRLKRKHCVLVALVMTALAIHATAANVTHATVHQRPSKRLKRNHYVLVALVMTVLVIHATAANVTHATVHQRLSRKLDVVEIRKLKLQRRVDVVEIRKLFNHKISQKLPSQLGVKRSQSKLKILIKQTSELNLSEEN